MKAIEWISSEAKKIRKKYPKKEWKDCIKQASAIYSSKHKGKVSGTKKPTKKSLHKDTKSHNVNIRVVSGVPKSKLAKKSVKEVLQKSGYRLPHGYTMVKGNVRTLSGVYSSSDWNNIELTRINNDINGNPRYVVHFLQLLNEEEKSFLPLSKEYIYALKKAKKIGGKKYHNKQYGGGVAFGSVFNTDDLKQKIFKLKHTTPNIKY